MITSRPKVNFEDNLASFQIYSERILRIARFHTASNQLENNEKSQFEITPQRPIFVLSSNH